MRLGTIDNRVVLIGDDGYEDLAVASDGELPADTIAVFDRWEEVRNWATATAAERRWSPMELTRLGPPVPVPRQVFALAANYADHAAEANIEKPPFPVIFTKFPSCITGPFDDVILPTNRADWEVELVVVIGRRAEHVSAAEAWNHVAGLTVGQDISERRVQFRKPGMHLDMAKSLPTFGPTGPWIVTTDEVGDPDDLGLRCSIDDQPMQDARTDQMIFSVAETIEYLTSIVALLPGDLIFTGTPSGVGSTRDPRLYLEPGNVITSEIDGIGTIRNTCRRAG